MKRLVKYNSPLGEEWNKLDTRVRKLIQQKWYSKALKVAKRVLKIAETFGTIHLDVARSLEHLAYIYECQHRYAKAVPFYKRASIIRKKIDGPNNWFLADNFQSLAEIYIIQKQYKKAESLYKRVITILEKILGKNHVDVGRKLEHFGSLYEMQGKYTKAMRIYKQALEISKRALGSKNSYTIDLQKHILELNERVKKKQLFLK